MKKLLFLFALIPFIFGCGNKSANPVDNNTDAGEEWLLMTVTKQFTYPAPALKHHQVYRFNLKNGSKQFLIDSAFAIPQIGSDKIVFQKTVKSANGNSYELIAHIANSDGTNIKQISDFPFTYEKNKPKLFMSPKGDIAASIEGQVIEIINISNGNQSSIDAKFSNIIENFVFSNDGARIAYKGTINNKKELHYYDIATTSDNSIFDKVTGDFCWSKDSKSIAFITQVNGQNQYIKYNIEDNKNPVAFNIGDLDSPVFCNGENNIVFSKPLKSGNYTYYSLWTMTADGKNLKQLTPGDGYSYQLVSKTYFYDKQEVIAVKTTLEESPVAIVSINVVTGKNTVLVNNLEELYK